MLKNSSFHKKICNTIIEVFFLLSYHYFDFFQALQKTKPKTYKTLFFLVFMMKKSVSLVEFSTTPTVSVMKTKTGENASSNENENAEQANTRVNAALAQLSQQQQGNNNNNNNQQNNSQQQNDEEGGGIFDLE